MRIEVYADVLCPWCYIGKRRLAAALAGLEERVEVAWRSFELAPDAPSKPDGTAAEAMRTWWGDQTESRIARIRSLGAAEGLELDLDKARPVNTFDAHRLIHLAADEAQRRDGDGDGDWGWVRAPGSERGSERSRKRGRNRGDAMVERLLYAYHTEGLNIGDPEVLISLGAEVGMEPAAVRAVLEGDWYGEQVRGDERRGRERGVSGVPTLVIADGAPMSAVQSPEALRGLVMAALEQSPV
ncbi:DsbA family oxidoreductase [Spirillospora sp. CA-253888]